MCILSYGIIMKKAVELATWLEQKGKSVSIVSVHTMKPLDRVGIEAALKSPLVSCVVAVCARNLKTT